MCECEEKDRDDKREREVERCVSGRKEKRKVTYLGCMCIICLYVAMMLS